MIAIVRKNLACLCSALSPNFFSSPWREIHSLTCPRVYDLLLHKHQFSPELASKAASVLALPENADSILSFLKQSGCSSTQLEKIVKYNPRILSHSVEDISFKIKIFQDLGLSPEDIAKMVSSNQVILHLRAKSKIIPSLSLLKGLLGSDCDVARLVRKSGWPMSADLDNTLVPNVEFLKSIGVPMERILYFLHSYPRSLLIKPDVLRKSVEKAKEMGINESSNMFVHALKITTSLSQGMWEVKLQSFQGMGFSESDLLAMFKKFPGVFTVSINKAEKIKRLLLGTGKYNMLSIVNNPGVFGCSIEQRLEPRLRVMRILESKNLIKKWPCLGACCSMPNDKFLKRFVSPYPDEVVKAFLRKSSVKVKT